ncbi:MAG: phosphate acyltransferase PlsX [Planctomycetota bacterium]
MRIAVDAMGGDNAPEEIVKGALLVAGSFPDATILLIGDKTAIEKCVGSNIPKNIEIVHTTQVVGMDESPVDAIRQKPDSSLVKCFAYAKNGKADAVVSAGNTGAAVAGATIFCGFLPGIKRAGISIPLPTEKGAAYLIDVGANIFCHPIHLLQYGIMAAVYAKYIRKVENPRVGLLNIGEEDSKGNELVQQTWTLMKKAPINFIGNIEGNYLFKGDCEVIVCEGFVGNVILKVVEGAAEFLTRSFMGSLMKLKDQIPQFEAMLPGLEKIKKQSDYSEYGGAMLMGINGVCIISHGRSNAKAIANAVKVAVDSVNNQVNQHIVDELHKTKLTWFDLYKSWKTHR